MPATERQIAANRRNAKKSTGPVTAEGKRRSSRNGTKHGLYSKDIVIDCPAFKEDREQYETLLVNLQEEFSPSTPYENKLVTTLTNSLWRLRRFSKVNRLSSDDTVSVFFGLLKSDFGFKHTSLPGRKGDPDLKKVRSKINRQMHVIYKMLKHLKETEHNHKPTEAQNESSIQNGNPNPTTKSYVRSHEQLTRPH